MRCTLTSFVSAALLLAGCSTALPTFSSPASVVRRDGPLGSVISPAGDTAYTVGDLIHLQYQKAETEEATTSALNITLRTFDGKVTYNSNVINLVQTLASPDDQSTIDAYFRIPQLVAGYDNPSQSSWVAHLEITETQTGSLGAAPFLAAAPRITIENA